MLKMPIFRASVCSHDAESEICMNIILKYNTCIINSIGIINKLFILFSTRFGLSYTDRPFKRYLAPMT